MRGAGKAPDQPDSPGLGSLAAATVKLRLTGKLTACRAATVADSARDSEARTEVEPQSASSCSVSATHCHRNQNRGHTEVRMG